jgi:hypothetical protein
MQAVVHHQLPPQVLNVNLYYRIPQSPCQRHQPNVE